jgi:hypothetical protein
LVCQPENQGHEQRDAKNAQHGQKPDLLLVRGKTLFSGPIAHISIIRSMETNFVPENFEAGPTAGKNIATDRLAP